MTARNLFADVVAIRLSPLSVVGLRWVLGVVACVVLLLASVQTAGFDLTRAVIKGRRVPTPEARIDARTSPTAVFSGEQTTDVLPNEPVQPTGTVGAVPALNGITNTGVLSIVAILQTTPVLVFEAWWAFARKRVRKGDSHRQPCANLLTDHPFGV